MHDVEIITDIWYQIICRVIYADTDTDQYNIIIRLYWLYCWFIYFSWWKFVVSPLPTNPTMMKNIYRINAFIKYERQLTTYK